MGLTIEQIQSLQVLSKNPLISHTSVNFFNSGNTSIVIASATDANWNQVDSLVDDVFPDMEYKGNPFVSLMKTGDICESYEIDPVGDYGVVLYLHMIASDKSKSETKT